MKISKLFNKITQDKKFYYLIVLLTSLSIFFYAYHKLYKALSLLLLSYIIIYNFNKNHTHVMLFSLIITTIFVVSGNIREGLENINNVDKDEIKNNENIDKLEKIDPELANVVDGVKNGTITKDNVKKVVEKKKDVINNISSTIKDPNNPENSTTNSTEDEPVPESFEGGKKGSVRLDHAATIETAYDDLQNILGSDGISRLTEDTKKLISQQKNLFTTMEQLAPAVKETVNMLEGMDFKGLSGMSETATSVAGKLQNLIKGNTIKPANEKI